MSPRDESIVIRLTPKRSKNIEDIAESLEQLLLRVQRGDLVSNTEIHRSLGYLQQLLIIADELKGENK